MFRRAVYALACVLALSMPAVAQEQTGQINGTVKDTSGAVLPGVTVEALSLATGAVASSVVTDGSGVYRFIGLRPGKYEISAKLQGFTTTKSQPVDLRLGIADRRHHVGGNGANVSHPKGLACRCLPWQSPRGRGLSRAITSKGSQA